MKSKAMVSVLLMVFLTLAGQVGAQVPPPAPDGQILNDPQLDQLLGPIALYPDPLIAQILPAATEPSQVAVAYSYITQGGDPNAIDQQPWDGSVKALARYPDVLKMLNDNLSWTAELGQAFLNQPTDVMNSVQRLRAQAQAMGNLESTPEMNVISDDGDIDLVPANPDLLYVPVYDPGIIFYQRPYGRRFITFGVGFRFGLWLNHDFDWHNHRVIVWGRDHPRPSNWWHARPDERRQLISHANPWRPPAERHNARPIPVNRGDRGYERPPARGTPPRDIHPAPRPGPGPGPTPRPEPRPQPPQSRPGPGPIQVHPIPAPAPRPTPAPPVHAPPAHVNPPPVRTPPSAFNGVQGGARETHAASTRGSVSRGVSSGGGRPSGGGGGRPSGGGNQKH